MDGRAARSAWPCATDPGSTTASWWRHPGPARPRCGCSATATTSSCRPATCSTCGKWPVPDGRPEADFWRPRQAARGNETMGSRRRGSSFTRFLEDIVDDTKDLVDDLIDRAKDVE